MSRFSDFANFVRCATRSQACPDGVSPYRFQQRLAEEGFPQVLQAPTGSGKSQAVLAYLWRRCFHPDAAVRRATPRRLVVALPARVLVEQLEESVRGWVDAVGCADEIDVHVLMGGRATRAAQHAWRMGLHRTSIVIGTVDMIVSRLLLRGYGSFRASYPIDFALVGNGALILVDEVQLAPQATCTLRQVEAFQRLLGTAEPTRLMVMSATVDERVLHTVDNPWPGEGGRVLTVDAGSESPELQRRLGAQRTVRQLLDADDPKQLPAAVAARHVPGTLTLVVLNQVERAVALYQGLAKAAPDEPRLLIHSQFRGVERQAQLARLREIAASGGIVVSTQAIEAGVDIDARTLVTEAATWASVVQRAGRCNRAGRLTPDEATLWWYEPAKPAPYDADQVTHAVAVLTAAEGQALTGAELYRLGDDIPPEDLRLRVLRARDFRQLFDTSPDLSGSDVDVSPYIRPDQDLDVHVAWVDDGMVESGDVVVPGQHLRCGVSTVRLASLLRRDDVRAWVFRAPEDRWVRASADQVRPQQLVLVEASSGGYDPELGFAPSSRRPVDPVADEPDLAAPEGDSPSADPGAAGAGWVPLQQHLDETRAQAQALADALAPQGVTAEDLAAAVVAAALHDLGKAHADWAEALRAANPDAPPPDPAGLYAKSPGHAPLRVRRALPVGRGGQTRTGFRHEVASVFMLRTAEGRALLDRLGVAAERQALVDYLVGSHHGHVRLAARDPRYDGVDGLSFLGFVDGESINPVELPGLTLPGSRADLGLFRSGPDSWASHAVALLRRLGPFRLAYLETLVRMADWRASASLPVPTTDGAES